MNKTYTTKEIAEIMNVSDRTVRRYLSSYYHNNNGNLEVSQKMLDILKRDCIGQSSDNERPTGRTEYFTEEEYQEFHRRLSEYPLLKEYIKTILNELDYHKKSAEKHQEQMGIILRSLEQRNFIEAKEKGMDDG